MKKFFATFTQKFVVWASDDVIQANRVLRRFAATQGAGTEALLELEKTLFAIRRDLGHGGGLTRGDLLALWVTDIDDALAKNRSGANQA